MNRQRRPRLQWRRGQKPGIVVVEGELTSRFKISRVVRMAQQVISPYRTSTSSVCLIVTYIIQIVGLWLQYMYAW